MRRVWSAVVVAVTVLATAGCFRLELTVDVRPDGSGTAREVFAVDRSKAERVLGSSDGLEQALPRADNISNLPTWARARPYRQGALQGVAVDVEFPSADQLGPRLAQLTEAITGTVGSPATSTVLLRREGAGWRFEAHQRQLGLQPDPAVRGSAIRAELYDTAQIRLVLRLPGRITAHNADHVEGNELTWDLPVTSDRSDLFAASAPLDAASQQARPAGMVAVALMVAAIGGAAVAGYVLLHPRRATATSGRPAPSGPPATSGPPTPNGRPTPSGPPTPDGRPAPNGRPAPGGPPTPNGRSAPNGPPAPSRPARSRGPGSGRPSVGEATRPANAGPAAWPSNPPAAPPLAPPEPPR